MRLSRWLVCLTLLHGLSPAWAGDAADRALSIQTVAPGIYVHTGAQAEASRDNGGDIANIGFIEGSECVAVVDTGGTPIVGRRLRQALVAETDKPICYVINTHMHPDHILGNRAFKQTGATFVAAKGFDRALAARSGSYLERIADTLGLETDASWIVMPERLIADHATLDLGDRKIELRTWAAGHTDNDMSVYDERTGTLWAGDLLFVDRAPSVDASLPGWIDVLDKLGDRYAEARTVIPGHGPVGHDLAAAIAPERRYLVAVREDVRAALDDGYGLHHAATHAAAGERDRWLLFDEYNVRNATAAYTELEWQ